MMNEARIAQPADLEKVMALYYQLNRSDPILAADQSRKTYSEILEADGLNIFVYESAGQIVSTCYLNIIPNLKRSASPYAVIENVVTDETQRGQGFGKLIIQHAVDYAWSRNCYKVMLMTGSKEESTHAFYRSCRFDGDEKQAYIIRAPKN